MAITASRTSLGMDREVNSEAASQRARRSLLNKGYRQARKEKDYGKALAFADDMEKMGMPRGTTGSAENVGSLAMGRVASRESLANQMRGQLPALAGQTREGNIANAKRSGTFDATRSSYNERAKASGKQMDEQGNISNIPAAASTPPAGGATPPVAAAGTPPLTTPAVEITGRSPTGAIPALTTPAVEITGRSPTGALPTAAAARVSVADQLINGKPVKSPMRPPEVPAAGTPTPAAGTPAPTARAKFIRDETGDITNRIRDSMAGKNTPATGTPAPAPAAPAAPADPVLDATLKQASALAGAFESGKKIAKTQEEGLNLKYDTFQASQARAPGVAKAARDSAAAGLASQGAQDNYTKLRETQTATDAVSAQEQGESDTARQAASDRLARRPAVEKLKGALVATSKGANMAANELVEGGVRVAANVDQALEPVTEFVTGSTKKSSAELADERNNARVLPPKALTAGEEQNRTKSKLTRQNALAPKNRAARPTSSTPKF